MLSNLNRKRVLVVGDQDFSDFGIVAALEAANAIVIGPCSSLAEAESRILQSDLGILDVGVRGRTSFALADRLLALDMPYVFCTPYERGLLPDRFARIDVVSRLDAPETAVRRLEIASDLAEEHSLLAVIPRLRARARSVLSDPLAADRLVERTLELAIEDPGSLPRRMDLFPWLLDWMGLALGRGRGRFLN